MSLTASVLEGFADAAEGAAGGAFSNAFAFGGSARAMANTGLELPR